MATQATTAAAAATTTLLILGQGFVGAYVRDLCAKQNIDAAATTTSGRDGTIPFKFDPLSTDPTPFMALPNAHTILITFPLTTAEPALILSSLYKQTHASSPYPDPHYILLGSTRAWSGSAAVSDSDSSHWLDRHSPIPIDTDPRLQAEESVLTSLSGVVLNLSGLWGGKVAGQPSSTIRDPRSWVSRVAATKSALADKGALHLIHGEDVARIVVRLVEDNGRFWTPRERWIVTDMMVYDWWALCVAWGSSSSNGSAAGVSERSPQVDWVLELMDETGVRGLPRPVHLLQRALDSRELWSRLDLGGPRHTLLTTPAL
eukprot:jgi/Hompol1/5616/HPOL_002010-RA